MIGGITAIQDTVDFGSHAAHRLARRRAEYPSPVDHCRSPEQYPVRSPADSTRTGHRRVTRDAGAVVSQPPSIVIELIRLPGNAAELKFRRTKDGAALPLRIDRPDDRISNMRRDLPFLLGDFRKAVASVDIDLDSEPETF